MQSFTEEHVWHQVYKQARYTLNLQLDLMYIGDLTSNQFTYNLLMRMQPFTKEHVWYQVFT